jgi:hypothetical protein
LGFQVESVGQGFESIPALPPLALWLLGLGLAAASLAALKKR